MEIITLKNKLRVLLHPTPTSRSAVFGYAVKAGSETELLVPPGISHFLEHMLFKGSQTKTAKQINEETANIGAELNAFTSEDQTKYYIQAQSKYAKEALGILSDFFWNPSFPKAEIAKEKRVIAEEINMYNDMPTTASHDKLCEILGRLSVLGTKKSVRSIKREQLGEYYQRHYHTDGAVFVATGNFDARAVCEQLENLEVNKPPGGRLIRKVKLGPIKKEEVIRRQTEQSHLSWAIPVAGQSAKDEAALEVLAAILGAHGNASSRLYDEIREEKGLAYAVQADLEKFSENGYLTGYVGLAPEHVAEVKNIIFTQCENLENEIVSETELRRAAACASSDLLIGYDDVMAQNDSLSYAALCGLDTDLDAYVREIEKITVQDIIRTAKKYRLSENIYFASVMPKRQRG